MSRNYPDLSTGLSSFGFSYGKLKGKGYCLYHGSAWGRGGTEGHKQSIKELKELIKKIYEYYKNK